MHFNAIDLSILPPSHGKHHLQGSNGDATIYQTTSDIQGIQKLDVDKITIIININIELSYHVMNDVIM